MLSQTAEYALRAMVYLAMEDASCRGQDIAEVTKVPFGYLNKIMQQLGRAKLVNSQRGLGGGFSLSKSAKKISILDVVNAVDPIERIRSCPLGIESHGFNLCPLHRQLSEATLAVESAFAKVSLDDLVEESKSPLCSSVPMTPRKGCT
jgi:Rrf2 family protein